MSLRAVSCFVLAAVCVALVGPARAQKPHRAAQEAGPPAKELFGAKAKPAKLPAQPIGSYARGCLAGAMALPIDGAHWQVMRLSRNRNWGDPSLVRMIERLANKVPKAVGWNGILVGDMSQPRGGPTITGHASHQIGLDVDVWLTPMPDHVLSKEERENLSAINMVAADSMSINPETWTAPTGALVKAAAEDPVVERVLVNAAIKKELCRTAGRDRAWLKKVRPWFLHRTHMHVRIACPPGDRECKPQPAPPKGDGCGKDLAWWFTAAALHPKPSPPRPPLKLTDLPPACRAVLNAP